MKLSRLFKGLTGQSRAAGPKDTDTASRKPSRESSASSSDADSEVVGGSAADTAPNGGPPSPDRQKPPATDIGDVANMFGTIQSVLDDQDDEPLSSQKYIEVPCGAVLSTLPEEARGTAWQDGNFPDSGVLLERDDVLRQLRHGRVAYPLAVLRPFLPQGWALPDVDVTVELDLPRVVAAVPSNLLSGANERSSHIEEVDGMRELFTPKRPLPQAQQEPAPQTIPADAAETPGVVAADETVDSEPPEAAVSVSAPDTQRMGQSVGTESVTPPPRRKYEPVGWNGIEGAHLTATGGVDINDAGVEDLEALPGVGPVRAKEIVEYRRRYGRFETIYDLASVPGIGARYFRQMTGLSLATGRNRHEVLDKLLDVEPGAALSLQRILQTLAESVDAVGTVLAGGDGVPLAYTPSLSRTADQYAAIGSQLFRRTGRYLEAIAGNGVDCLALPASNPPLLLFAVNDVYLCVVQDDKHAGQRQFKKAYAVAREIGWLLGKRAIVRHA